MLFNEPKLLKSVLRGFLRDTSDVSVLFNEPKLLKLTVVAGGAPDLHGFSALQRAEIAEIKWCTMQPSNERDVSVLFNEPKLLKFIPGGSDAGSSRSFSALQRAEIAEMLCCERRIRPLNDVSVLFNEPKLLKSYCSTRSSIRRKRFQCSSTSRNC